ncbi:hypothetical protein Pelo_702 [Pelomyxa schiedti]|nr:hypothetical protein Pelo_702 [Pelomyxa schiedti]
MKGRLPPPGVLAFSPNPAKTLAAMRHGISKAYTMTLQAPMALSTLHFFTDATTGFALATNVDPDYDGIQVIPASSGMNHKTWTRTLPSHTLSSLFSNSG